MTDCSGVGVLSIKELLTELADYVEDSANAGLFMCTDEYKRDRAEKILAELQRRKLNVAFTAYEESLKWLDEVQDSIAVLAKDHFLRFGIGYTKWQQ